jgi:hypothetical protein
MSMMAVIAVILDLGYREAIMSSIIYNQAEKLFSEEDSWRWSSDDISLLQL